MTNVVSYAFFRSDASGYESERAGAARGIFFVNFLRNLVRAHHAVWTGWELRIHHDDRVKAFPYFKALERMATAGLLKLVDCGKAETLCGSMLWRMLPIWDKEPGHVVCRDVDSLAMPRDRVMVEEAINAGAEIHCVLDSESHSGPIMGGMCKFRNKAISAKYRSLNELIWTSPDIDLNRHGADQRILNRALWPEFSKYSLIHQRRQDIQYPEAMETRPVAPRAHDLDRIVHMGAAYDVEKARPIIEGNLSPAMLERIVNCEADPMQRYDDSDAREYDKPGGSYHRRDDDAAQR